MPFGAVIVAADGRVLAEAENSTVVDKDIASHAEINAIRKVCTNGAQESLAGATIYTNCPPCPMCFGAIIPVSYTHLDVYKRQDNLLGHQSLAASRGLASRSVIIIGRATGVDSRNGPGKD